MASISRKTHISTGLIPGEQGIPIPKSVEFPSIASLVRGEGAPKYDAIFSRFQNYQRTVRKKDYKLVVYPIVNKVQLFDLNKNP